MLSTMRPLFAAFSIGFALLGVPRPPEHASVTAFGHRARVRAERFGLVATVLPDGRTVRAERLALPELGPLGPSSTLWEVDVVAAENDPSRCLAPGDVVGPHAATAREVWIAPDRIVVAFADGWAELDATTGAVTGGGVD